MLVKKNKKIASCVPRRCEDFVVAAVANLADARGKKK